MIHLKSYFSWGSRKVTLQQGNHSYSDTLSLDETRNGTKLEKTSLSTDVFQRSLIGTIVLLKLDILALVKIANNQDPARLPFSGH